MSDKVRPISGRDTTSDKIRPISGGNMNDKTNPHSNPHGLWERTKTWVDQNRTISGAIVGGATGTILPGIGTLIGSILGAGVGFASSKERKEER